MIVEDDGVGFDSARAGREFTRDGGFGLFSVLEQMRRIGGELRIDSTPGSGTRVVASADLDTRSADEPGNRA